LAKIRVSRYRRTYGVLGQRATDIIGAVSGSSNPCLLPASFVACEVFTNVAALEADSPAASNSGSFGLAFLSSLPYTYQSNGTTWQVLSGSSGSGSLALTTQVVSSNTTAGANNVLLVDASSGNIEIKLPDATSSPSSFYHIKKTDSSNNFVVITTTGLQTIDGAAPPVSFNFSQQIYQFVTDGSNWHIL
jgi:hypothetical protein